MRLSELGELGLLAELERRGLISGVENDAAQLERGVVVTQDALVEGVHFRLDWLSWRELGFRAAAVNLSDLAASGAKPEALVVTLALPAETAVADVLELYEGLAEPGVPVVGGDTTAASQLVISVTAIGRAERDEQAVGPGPGGCEVAEVDRCGPEAEVAPRDPVEPEVHVLDQRVLRDDGARDLGDVVLDRLREPAALQLGEQPELADLRKSRHRSRARARPTRVRHE